MTKQNIKKEFQNYGATCVRGAFDANEIIRVKEAISQNIKNPSPMF